MDMKYIYEIYFVLFGLVLNASGLVYLDPVLHPGETGCIAPSTNLPMEVGSEYQVDDICGVYICMNKLGQGIYQFCQKPVPYAECESDAINLSPQVSFPQCCWHCVYGVEC